MRRLLPFLALLLLESAMAQEIVPGPYIPPPPPPLETGNIIYTTLNPPPQGAQFNWSGFVNQNTGGGGLQGGNIPAYNSNTGTFVFGYMQGTPTYNFYGSSEWPNGGIQVDGFKYSWEYFNQDFSRGFISGNVSIFGTNNNLLENINFAMPQTTEGWTIQSGQIDFANPYDRSELGRLQLSFTGRDDRFWAGYWGPQVRDLDVSIMYSTPSPAIPNFLYWNNVAGEWGTFTLAEETTVRYGAQGVYVYATLQAGTYECSNGAWGVDPIGGVVKSCETGSDIPLAIVNCDTDPANQECAILALTDPEEIAGGIIDDILADITEDNSEQFGDDGSNDGSEIIEEEEEVLVVDNSDENLEELLQDEELAGDEIEASDEEETVVASNEQSSIREIANEEKATALADNINTNVLELALSVSDNAVSIASTATEQTTSTTTTATTGGTRTTAGSDATETKSDEIKSEQEIVVADSGIEVATELLDVGRSLNATSMAATQALSEQTASDSINQAESIAISSGESRTTDTVTDTSVASNIDNNISNTQSTGNEVSDTVVEQNVNDMVVEEMLANNLEQNVLDSTNSTDSFGDIMNLVIAPTVETKDEDVEFVQNQLAQTEQKNEDTNSTFSEDERITIQNDPNLSNAFNVVPNVSNLELLGVLANRQEEKSDAEKRAEQVVAANKEQQEEINKNYMDADQSGIVAAMSGDTDVSSYRSAMLNDNNIWYKPEDIYKNVVYKDNARGMYFLEKGNTDTYKKMIEEQYK